MKLVKNDVVKMDWDADLFVDNKYIGFVAACKQYDDLTVVFQEGTAFAFYNAEEPIDAASTLDIIKKSYKIRKGKNASVEREYLFDEFGEYTILISGDDVYQNNVDLVGLTDEDVEDMKLRLADLAPYDEETIVDSL